MQDGYKTISKGQCEFRVWANSNVKVNAWKENGYERWQFEDLKEGEGDGAKKIDGNLSKEIKPGVSNICLSHKNFEAQGTIEKEKEKAKPNRWACFNEVVR